MKKHYYGITRSDEYLAHYGVKGMKWGVRKAIEKGDSKALKRHYEKAAKKLAKLKKNENVGEQQKAYKRDSKIAATALGIGATGIGTALGARSLSDSLFNAASKTWDSYNHLQGAYMKDRHNLNKQIAADRALAKSSTDMKTRHQIANQLRSDKAALNTLENNYKQTANEQYKQHSNQLSDSGKAQTASNIAGAIGAAGLATGAVLGGKAALHKYRTTEKGHAKAVEKRKDWEKEMRQTFKGTKYASLPVPKKSANKEKWKKNLQQDLRDAAASALVGPFLVSSRRAVVGDENRLSDGKPYGSKKKRKG